MQQQGTQQSERCEECRLHIDGARTEIASLQIALDEGRLENAAFHARQIAWHTRCAEVCGAPGYVSTIQIE